MVFVFGMMNYGLKDNSIGSRNRFGLTFPIARSAALVLHVVVAFILFPVCRNLLYMDRLTPLKDVITFDKNITFN